MSLLTKSTATDLLTQDNQMVKMLVSEMSQGLTIQKAMQAPKMFQVQKRIGIETLIKLLCVVIKSFCDSIKAKNTMDTVDIFECAELIAETYTHDSVKDIVMALKQAKKRGMNFYNAVSTPVIFEIITDYMNNKTEFIEKSEADAKSLLTGSVRTESGTISAALEKFQKEKEKSLEQKTLKAIQDETKEMKKVADYLDKTIKKL